MRTGHLLKQQLRILLTQCIIPEEKGADGSAHKYRWDTEMLALTGNRTAVVKTNDHLPQDISRSWHNRLHIPGEIDSYSPTNIIIHNHRFIAYQSVKYLHLICIKNN
jgi:hypothetical protein